MTSGFHKRKVEEPTSSIFARFPLTMRFDQGEFCGLKLIAEREGHHDPQRVIREAVHAWISSQLGA